MSKEKTAEGKESTSNGISRLILIGISLIFEIVLSVVIVLWLGSYMKWIEILIHVIGAVLVLIIYSQPRTASVKMPLKIPMHMKGFVQRTAEQGI